MGAWGYNSFENDDAMDWVADLEASEDFSAIAAALDAVLANVGEFLDARECSNAIAAAEAIAIAEAIARKDDIIALANRLEATIDKS